jgi:hypothetical protein
MITDDLVRMRHRLIRDHGKHRGCGCLREQAGQQGAVNALGLFRRNRDLERKYAELGRDLESADEDGTADFDRAISDDIDDDLLRLIFTACHPVLPVQSRVALTLRLLGGLTTSEIARAYLVPEPTIAQRIVRAKKTLATAKVPFERLTARGPGSTWSISSPPSRRCADTTCSPASAATC